MASGIYEIVNLVNGHRYVGSAVNVEARWRVHRSDLNGNKHHSQHLQNSWNKYGSCGFEFRVVEHCFIFALIWREQFWIDALKPEYNVAPTAGSPLGRKHSPETRAKLSAARKKRVTTYETRAKMSASMIGKKHFGRKHTAESKAKIGAFWKGKKRSPETRTKMSAAQKGNKHSLGHKHTDEAKAKISASMMGNKKGKRKPK